MIAMTTISRPLTKAAPMSRLCSAWTTGPPRPGPSTSAAIVAIDSAAIVHWLSPTTIVRRAIGSCTLRSFWPLLLPRESAASSVPSETVRMPWAVMRISGEIA